MHESHPSYYSITNKVCDYLYFKMYGTLATYYLANWLAKTTEIQVKKYLHPVPLLLQMMNITEVIEHVWNKNKIRSAN